MFFSNIHQLLISYLLNVDMPPLYSNISRQTVSIKTSVSKVHAFENAAYINITINYMCFRKKIFVEILVFYLGIHVCLSVSLSVTIVACANIAIAISYMHFKYSLLVIVRCAMADRESIFYY